MSLPTQLLSLYSKCAHSNYPSWLSSISVIFQAQVLEFEYHLRCSLQYFVHTGTRRAQCSGFKSITLIYGTTYDRRQIIIMGLITFTPFHVPCHMTHQGGGARVPAQCKWHRHIKCSSLFKVEKKKKEHIKPISRP